MLLPTVATEHLTAEEERLCLSLKRALLRQRAASTELSRAQRAATEGGTSPRLLRAAQEEQTASTVEVNEARSRVWAAFLARL